jgi:Protein of unknown function (DUF2911)
VAAFPVKIGDKTMQNSVLKCVLLLAASCAIAPAQAPAPGQSVTIDGKAISVKFSGPAMKGRKVFGGAVPFNQVWKIGDNSAAAFHTDADLVFQGFTVPKGDYTLYVLPVDAAKWQLIINKATGAKALTYDQKLDVGRVAMKIAAALAPIETCRVSLVKSAAMAARIEVAWENVVAQASFHLDRVGGNSEW